MRIIPPLDFLTLPLRSTPEQPASHLIEASAGTGKTWTIAMLYVRLILETDLMPPDILVVTFTEAATRELRDRIRRRLAETARVFSAATGTRVEGAAASSGDADKCDPILLELRDRFDPQALPRLQKRLTEACEWMDEAAVFTIHGWCQRMLTEHAFDSGSLFQQEVVDLQPLRERVVCDYWRKEVYPLTPTLFAVYTDLATCPVGKAQRGERTLLGKVWPLLNAGVSATELTIYDSDGKPRRLDCDLSLTELIETVQQWRVERLNALRNTVRPALEGLQKWFDERRAGSPGLPVHATSLNTVIAALAKLIEWSQLDCGRLPTEMGASPTGLANLHPDGFKSIWNKNGKAAEACPDLDGLKAIAWLFTEVKRLPDPVAACRIHAMDSIGKRLESEKKRTASMGFDDMLTRLDAALQGSRGAVLADRIRHQFPVAMIDEFQDTDPLQFRIFNSIYQPASPAPGIGFVMIGDPKQAIYAFRNADIFAYLAARDAVADRQHSLDRNFRSEPAMVEAVNVLFSAGSDDKDAPVFCLNKVTSKRLDYQPVKARSGVEREWCVDSKKAAGLTIWTLDSNEKFKNKNLKGIAKAKGRHQIAQACADEITHLLALGASGAAGFRRVPADAAGAGSDPGDALLAPSPGDFAILVNNGVEAAIIRSELQARNLRSVYLSDKDSVFDNQEARDLLYWLRAVAMPDSLGAARAAWATPTLQLGLPALFHRLQSDSELDQAVNALHGYQQLWQQQGVLALLHRWLFDHALPSRLLATGEERVLTNLLHIGELLQEQEPRVEGELALIQYYERLLSGTQVGGGGDDPRILRLESDADRVKVITVHKSKGLEFPLVFVPFATDFRATTKGDGVFKYHDSKDRLRISMAPEALGLAEDERQAEDVRKCYVALTRARHATWVGAVAFDAWEKSGFGSLLKGPSKSTPISEAVQHLASTGGGLSASIRVTTLPEPRHVNWQAPAEPAMDSARTLKRGPASPWFISSYSGLLANLDKTGASSPVTVNDRNRNDESAVVLDTADNTLVLNDDASQDRFGEEPLVSVRPAGSAPDQHGFPRGAQAGDFLHALLEWCTETGFQHVVADPELLRQEAGRRCSARGWDQCTEVLVAWVLRLLQTPLPLDGPAERGTPLRLGGLREVRAELEFWFQGRQVSLKTLDRLVTGQTLQGQSRPPLDPGRALNGMLKGFIDLTLQHDGRYYVLDYKSNWLGPDNHAYTQAAMQAKMLGARYDLQLCLYVLALHRLLRTRLPDYDYDRHVGGAIYLFLRGIDAPATAGTFHERPPRSLIDSLDALFDGTLNPAKENAA